MQAKQSTKCSQSYEYKYLEEYINVKFTKMCLGVPSKVTSMVHIIFLGEHTAEGRELSSSTVGLIKSDQKQKGNFLKEFPSS